MVDDDIAQENAAMDADVVRLDRLAAERKAPAFSEEALALTFSARYAASLRYVHGWGKWFLYDGRRWEMDDTLSAFDRARLVCREAAEACNEKGRTGLASAKSVAAVVSLARSDRRHAATVDQWDADPWALNTPAGVVDLRSGMIRQHNARDHFTKITAVAPSGTCPRWLEFLDRITGRDTELQSFMRRMAGYALTGSTREHALFFGYGTGANGKSVFANTLAACLGDYHKTAPIETFTASNSDRHPTELAGLRGARLVTAIETEEGRRWAESRIKALTGGDTISARFMRQDFFEYRPAFKLLIAGNHKPSLRSVDEAIRRRFHLLPFAVTIPPEERDEGLPDALKGEWPGILRWAIEGCLDWQRIGLAPPEAVRAATAAYLEAQDAMAAWMDERCERDPRAFERTTALFTSWKAWADAAGEFPGKLSQFKDKLEAIGLQPAREAGTGQRGYQGIRLLGGAL